MESKLSCRICTTTLDINNKILHLNESPLTDQFISKTKNNFKKGSEFIKEINIYICPKCGVIQNPLNFEIGEYYVDYAYTSGSSPFVKEFMEIFSEVCLKSYEKVNRKKAKFVLEPGSGDGEQLACFLKKGLNITGIEPSEILANKARENGIYTKIGFFDFKSIDKESFNLYDICLCSYTFDHSLDPIDFVKCANKCLKKNGILAIEVHNALEISNRAEYCLLEHEHTIYLCKDSISVLLESLGFEILEVNPIQESKKRANSLIVVAKKIKYVENISLSIFQERKSSFENFNNLQDKIKNFNEKIDNFVFSKKNSIIGYGAGGRGVMTLAQMNSSDCFQALLDKNFDNRNVFTPKTHIPVVGPKLWKNFNQNNVLVFSFGYFDEIVKDLVNYGFKKEKIFSIKEFF